LKNGGIASGFVFGYDPTGRSVFFKIDRILYSIFDIYPPPEDSMFISFFLD